MLLMNDADSTLMSVDSTNTSLRHCVCTDWIRNIFPSDRMPNRKASAGMHMTRRRWMNDKTVCVTDGSHTGTCTNSACTGTAHLHLSGSPRIWCTPHAGASAESLLVGYTNLYR